MIPQRRWLLAGLLLTTVLAVIAVITAVLAFLGLREEVKDRQSADRAQTRAQVAELRSEITAELDRRTAARNRKDLAQQARTRAAICTVLASDLTPSRSVRALAVQLSCPLDPAGRPLPVLLIPQPSVSAPASPGAPRPRAQPAPAPTTSRRPTRSPSPTPSPTGAPSTGPSPTCLPLLIVTPCLR